METDNTQLEGETLKNKYLKLESQGIFNATCKKTKKSDFFKTGENGITKLCLNDNFKKIFLSLVDETIISRGIKVEKLKINKPINNLKIQQEITGKVQSPNDIAVKIIALVSAQPKGEDGVLLNNGYANIFYFNHDGRLFYVLVNWHIDEDEWYCSCCEAIGYTWNASRCIFTIVTEAQSSEA